jgi:hypothetical protein
MRRVPVLLLLALLAGGCGSPSQDHAGGAQPTPRTELSSPGTPTRSPSASATPDPQGQPTPATTAGPLGEQDVPQARDLGQGWTEYADPGGAEAGFVGNGSFVRERDPAGVVQGLVPLGCPGVGTVGPVPTPGDALEATYRTSAGAPAVVLVLQYDDATASVRALRQLHRMRATCTPPTAGEAAQGRTVIHLERADDDRIWDRRTTIGEEGAVWLELVVRAGDRVGIMAMAATQRPAGGFAALDDALRAHLAHG